MTRGTIAFVDFDEQTQKWYLYNSTEFNGDMGPYMSSGEKLLKIDFRDIFYNENDSKSMKEKLQQVVLKTIERFGYEDDYDDNSEFSDLFDQHELELDVLDLAVNKDDFWSNYFNYSDWGYIINISNKPFTVVDKKEKRVELLPKDRSVLCLYFANAEYFYNPTTSLTEV